LLLLWLPAAIAAEPVRLIYGQSIQSDDPTQQYPLELLTAAFAKVGVQVDLQRATTGMVQQRSLKAIAAAQQVDVFWSMTSIEREQQLLPVRIPIDKGLYGWRLLLIAKNRPLPLPKLHDLRGLQQLTLLQGHDWPDATILEKNALKVLTSSQYQSLFTMLAKHRGDAFPRSLLEIWQEQSKQATLFQVEPDVVLHYPTAVYFFLHKDNKQLAAQLEAGLNALINSGEFELLFQRYFAAALAQSCLGRRQIIRLHNPLLPVATPLGRAELWFKPDNAALCQSQIAAHPHLPD
jgi:hypothetical protein